METGYGKQFDGSFHDLERYGIEFLTGEADATSLRVLCDVSPAGVQLLERFLSVRFTDDNNSWNHQGIAGWKSILLPREIVPLLLTFALIEKDKYPIVARFSQKFSWGYASGIQAFQTDAEYREWKEHADRIYEGNYHVTHCPDGKTRNTHAFSGRTE